MRALSAPLAGLLVLLGAVVAAQEQPPPAAPARRTPSPYPQRATRPDAEPQAVALVDDALTWLARHQEPDGHWSAARWRARCAQEGACASIAGGSDAGLAGFDVGVTAIATLAFLGHGHTAPDGAHAAVVDRALAWLVAKQGDEGAIGFSLRDAYGFGAVEHGEWTVIEHIPTVRRIGDPEPPDFQRHEDVFRGADLEPGWALYNHALSTLALCEALALGADPARLRAPAERALAFVVLTQNPSLGWHYASGPGATTRP